MSKNLFADHPTIDGEKGFQIIPQLLTDEGLRELTRQVEHIIEELPAKWLDENCVRNTKGEILVIKSLDIPSAFIFSFAREQLFVEMSEDFGGKKTVPLYVEYFDKPPYSNDATPPHQDQAFYQRHFTDEFGITFWIALDSCKVESGCLFVCPTEDRVFLKHRESNNKAFTVELESLPDKAFFPVELEPGGCLIHGAYTPHYSTPNTTGNHRRALAITYRTSEYREQMFRK